MTNKLADSVLGGMAVDMIGALAGLKKTNPLADVLQQRIEAVNAAQNALRARERSEKNDPLTLEELREMNGEPVYLDCGGVGEWGLVIVSGLAVFLRHKNGIKAPANIAFECGVKIYRHKPEEE